MWEFIDNNEENEEINRPSISYWQDVWRRFKENKLSIFGLLVLIFISLLAIFGPLVSQYKFSDQNLKLANMPPILKVYEFKENYYFLNNDLNIFVIDKKNKSIKRIETLEKNYFENFILYKNNKDILKLDYKNEKEMFFNNNKIDKTKYIINKFNIWGTDTHGRDIFVRVLVGARISLLVALIATIVSFFIGVVVGGISGYFGGIIDNILMRLVDIISTIPLVLYVILLMVVLGSGLMTIIIALGSVYWVNMARIVRGQSLSIKNQEFVLAAKTIGVSDSKIIIKHILPNILGPIIVTSTMMIPGAIFTESFLSFIGLGISAPMASLGTLVNDSLAGIRVYPYQLLYPAFTISIIMLTFNFIGDGLRDALDPRLRK